MCNTTDDIWGYGGRGSVCVKHEWGLDSCRRLLHPSTTGRNMPRILNKNRYTKHKTSGTREEVYDKKLGTWIDLAILMNNLDQADTVESDTENDLLEPDSKSGR